jgi:hypothetical protein
LARFTVFGTRLTEWFVSEVVFGNAEGLFVTSDAACAFDSHGVVLTVNGVAFFASFGANSTLTGFFIGIGVRRTEVSRDTSSKATKDGSSAGIDDIFNGEVRVIHVSSLDKAGFFISGSSSHDVVVVREGVGDLDNVSPEESGLTGLPVTVRLKSAFGTGHTVLMTGSALSRIRFGEVEVVSFLAGGTVE